jgi:hypothetical protein
MSTVFQSIKTKQIGTTEVQCYSSTGVSTLIGVNLSNIATQSITISAYIKSGGSTYYIIKDTVIPSGNSLSLLKDSKIVLNNGDQLYMISSTAISLDAILSMIIHP